MSKSQRATRPTATTTPVRERVSINASVAT